MRTINENLLFRRELAKSQGVSLFQADNLIAKRAQVIAKLAGISWGGHDKRGVLFEIFATTGRVGECIWKHTFFDYEMVIDEPSQVIAWARETNARIRQEQKKGRVNAPQRGTDHNELSIYT